MIVDQFVIKARIRWPNAAHIKECAEVLSEVKSDPEPCKTRAQSPDPWRKSLTSVTTNHPSQTVIKATIMMIMIMN
jgi:hypothetical protein